jgi:hypothetical protein
MTIEQMSTDKVYAVSTHPGIAWRFDGPRLETSWEYICEERDESGECWYEEDLTETGDANMHMIGDDRLFVIDPEDCTELDDSAYCPGCGQIGCGAHAIPLSEALAAYGYDPDGDIESMDFD